MNVNDEKKQSEKRGVFGKNAFHCRFYDVSVIYNTASRNNSLLSFIFLKACVFVLMIVWISKDERTAKVY